MGIKEKTFGEIRYFTYYLIFPDGDIWVDQIPFVHDLQFELKNTRFAKDPLKARDILIKGETSWKDHNGVRHRIKVEHMERPKQWGKNGKGRAIL